MEIVSLNTKNDTSITKNVLFVNSAVMSLHDYINPETLAIGYNDQTSTRDDMMQCFISTNNSNTINRIGFAFHYSELNDPNLILFLNQEPFFTDSDLEESESVVDISTIYSPNVQFMLDLLLSGGITHVDFLACNTLQNEKWKRYYQLLQSKTGVVIGASDNNTGNLRYGGDWIMESTHEEVGQIYFTTAIENYVDLLFDIVLVNSTGRSIASRACFCIGGDFMYSANISTGFIRRTDLRDNSVIENYYNNSAGVASMTLFYYNGFIYARSGSYDVCKIDVRGNTGVLINAVFVDTDWMGDPSLFCSDGTFLYCTSSAVSGTISRAYLGSAESTTAPRGTPPYLGSSGTSIPAGSAAQFISNLNFGRQPCIVGEFIYVPIYGENKIKKYQLSTGALVDGDLTKGVAISKLCGMVYYDSFFYVSQSYVYVGGQNNDGKSTVPHGIWKIGLNGSVEFFFSDLMTVGAESWYADYIELAIYNDKLYCLEFKTANIISIDLRLSTVVLSACNSTSTQRFQMKLVNSVYLTAPIVQFVQDISQNATGYSSNAVNQRFVFGSCIVDNPLELNSTLNADGTAISSYVKANNFLMYSDTRLKQNIEGMSELHGVDNIRTVQYYNKSDRSKHFGVIAHELAEIYPDLVHSDDNNMLSVSYTELIPICINEIHQLKKNIECLQSQLDLIEGTQSI
jgi:hypothetical protein